MAIKLAVLIVHGMGSQVEGYETGLVRELSRFLDGDPESIGWKAVFWQDITEQRQLQYLEAARAQGELDWFAVRRFVATALGDAAAYQFAGEGSTYQRIHTRIKAAMKALHEEKLGGTEVPLVVLAHSLGSHIISNYIWDMQNRRGPDVHGVWEETLSSFEQMKTQVGFITFGSTIPLFTFSYDDPEPITFPGEDLSTEVRGRAAWLNYYDRDDVLGWPLRPLSPKYAAAVDEDIEIDAGSWGAGLTPLSHVAYWTDNSFTRPVARFLDTFI
jgi:hypothetical protein